nr:hypothetical protein [Pseudomonadota bacterium]
NLGKQSSALLTRRTDYNTESRLLDSSNQHTDEQLRLSLPFRQSDDRYFASEPSLLATAAGQSLFGLSQRLTAAAVPGSWLVTQVADIENSLLSFEGDDRMSAAAALLARGDSDSIWSAEFTTARSQ